MTSRCPFLLAACVGLVSVLMTGCQSSQDAHIYESTPMLPMTVTVVDSTTGESLWSLDVPVNSKLKIRFYDDREPNNASGNRTAMMRWDLTNPDKNSGKLTNEEAVPLAHSRRIDVSLRDIPEFATSGAFVAPTTSTSPPPTGSGNMLPSEMDPARPSKDSPPELDPVEIPSGG